MRILILGIDGYIGWSLALYLKAKGHEIVGVDNGRRRLRVRDLGGESLTPIMPYPKRREYFGHYNFIDITLGRDGSDLPALLQSFNPEAIVHLAEQPSAAWSMASLENASITQQENIVGTLEVLWGMKEYCPSAHLVKLGTMGEYGTPECDIPEGMIPEKCLGTPVAGPICPMKGLPFPRSAGSFYHLSKVHDTHNIIFACKNWGLRSTDIMQGVVFGLNEVDDPRLLTRFDYDECFGTVINRFCVQAIAGILLTIYGSGRQTRGYLPLKDSLQCLEIAIMNPPKEGEYRTLNQFENIYSVQALADRVMRAAVEIGVLKEGDIGAEQILNPRKEAEQHYYNPAHQKLFDLGYKPTTNIQLEITNLIHRLIPFRRRIQSGMAMPTINWRR